MAGLRVALLQRRRAFQRFDCVDGRHVVRSVTNRAKPMDVRGPFADSQYRARATTRFFPPADRVAAVAEGSAANEFFITEPGVRVSRPEFGAGMARADSGKAAGGVSLRPSAKRRHRWYRRGSAHDHKSLGKAGHWRNHVQWQANMRRINAVPIDDTSAPMAIWARLRTADKRRLALLFDEWRRRRRRVHLNDPDGHAR